MRTVIFIGLIFFIFFILRKLEKKEVKFPLRTMGGMVMGLALGTIIQAAAGFPDDTSNIIWIKKINEWYSFAGLAFMDLLKMIVVPLVFISILRVIIHIGEDNNKDITLKTVKMLLLTTAISAFAAIVVGNLMHLGVEKEIIIVEGEKTKILSLTDTVRRMIPSNPIAAMAEGNTTAIIIFACFLGAAVRRLNKKYADMIKPFIDLTEAFYKIIISVLMTVIKFMPYAVTVMMADTIASRGFRYVFLVLKFIGALYISAAVVFVIHLIIIALNGLNPFKYLKNVYKALITAFTSRSSSGTLPVSIETLIENQGVDEETANFAASLSVNMGMNGCTGIYPALMAVTAANMAGIEMNMSFYVMLLTAITLNTIGISGIPGTAVMSLCAAFSGTGLAPYFILVGPILGVDPILDMARTTINVNGGNVTAVTVANACNRLDKEIFKK